MLRRLRADFREMFTELVVYRELLYSIAWRDLLLRYKQTVMGFGWALFMPVLNTIVFSVIFMRVARVDTGMPYPLFAFTGLFAWNLFASSLRFSLSSLTGNSELVTKVYFPREVFPFANILVSLIDFFVGLLLLVVMMIYYRVAPSWTILFLPVVLLVQLAFTGGCALLLALGNLFYRDIKYLFEIVLTVWMFATSVVYPVQLVGGRAGAILAYNPMTPIIEGYRSVLLRGELPPAGPFLVTAVTSVIVLAGGWLVFHRAEITFAENI